MKRCVITGMGAITPLGNDVESYWENLKNMLQKKKLKEMICFLFMVLRQQHKPMK